ncbi:MAG: hypothetical protein PVI97_08870 [Candidatus Thiodiazotropha sp.]|jgi:hypothetical protein
MNDKLVEQQNYAIPTDCLDCSRDNSSKRRQLENSMSWLLSNVHKNSNSADAGKIAEIVDKILDDENQREKDDACHDLKRRISFEIMDRLLQECSEGKCPMLNPAYHKCLIDISAEGYVRERAYYYSKDEGENNTEKYYFKALSRIQKVLSCALMPKLNDELFEIDNLDLHGNLDHRKGAERRKAYWRYKSRQESSHKDGDQYTDFCESCSLLDAIETNSSAKLNKAYYEKHIDMINGLDLFRFCFARANSVTNEISEAKCKGSL